MVRLVNHHHQHRDILRCNVHACVCVCVGVVLRVVHIQSCSTLLSRLPSLLLKADDNAAYGSIAGVATPGSLPPSFHSILRFVRRRATTRAHTRTRAHVQAHIHVHHEACSSRIRTHGGACFRSRESMVALRWA